MKQSNLSNIMTISIALLCGIAHIMSGQSKDESTTPRRRLISWTSDRREYQVGDVITVLVSEATLASATKSQSGSDQQTRKNDLGLTPPKIGTSALPEIDATMSMGKNASSKQDGNASRNVNFRGDISVRVVAVDAKTGLLQIKGTKMVDVDKNKQTLNLAGWVRPEDVSMDNAVLSERVADAQLTYSLSGDLGKTRGGIIGRLLNVFWP
jgi:flagellar L-ring protein precursor FlgH